MPNPMIAAHLITWGEEWQQALDDVAAVGVQGCEPRAYIAALWQENPLAFRALLEERGLALAGLYADCRLTEPEAQASDLDRAIRVARFVKTCGGSRLVVGGGVRDPVAAPDAAWAQLAATLEAIGRACLDLGVVACYHPHLGTLVETPAEIDRVMGSTDPALVKLCVDTGHIAKAGGRPEQVIRQYGDRLAHVHLKDVRPGSGTWDGQDLGDVFTGLGQGLVDLPAALEALRAVAYQGWVTVELDRSDRPPIESLRASLAYLERTSSTAAIWRKGARSGKII